MTQTPRRTPAGRVTPVSPVSRTANDPQRDRGRVDQQPDPSRKRRKPRAPGVTVDEHGRTHVDLEA